MDGFVDGRHPDAGVEEWVFAAWNPEATVGIICGHRIIGTGAWYWAALARRGRPLLHITDFDIGVRADPFVIKGDALWAEHTCEAEMEQWSIGNETYALAIDDPAEALGMPYGYPTPIAFDLEWYATGSAGGLPGPEGPSSALGYEQPGVVHGSIEILHEPSIELVEVPASRWHRWTPVATTDSRVMLGPLMLPSVVAHTGVRAPFAFPDGSISDLVLTSAGWAQRGLPDHPER